MPRSSVIINNLATRVRLELTHRTNGERFSKPLQYHYAYLAIWQRWLDSNQRMRESKSLALPLGDTAIYTADCSAACFYFVTTAEPLVITVTQPCFLRASISSFFKRLSVIESERILLAFASASAATILALASASA